MNVVHSYVVGAYLVALVAAVLATAQAFQISRKLTSRHLRGFWLTITILSGSVEILHAWTVVYLALMKDNARFLSSATIILGAGGMFLGMAILMRLSIDDILQVSMLRQLAFHDPLTGAGNRRAFEQDLAAAAQRGPVGLALIDIDHFKGFNDTHGHEIGDLVLKHVAEVIRDATSGHAVYRIGGEEFGVCTAGDAAETAALAEWARQAVGRTPLIHLGRAFPATISVGVAILGRDEPVAALLRRADRALYAAKRSGRNRVRGGVGGQSGAM